MMEALQVVKYALKGQRGLSFTAGWQVSEVTLNSMSIEDMEDSTALTKYAQGQNDA